MITGGGGFLGQYLNVELSKRYDTLTLFRNSPGNCVDYKNQKINIIDFDSLEKLLIEYRPNVVVHTAAVSSSAEAEKLSSKEVFLINVSATKKIAELCKANNCRMIYTSTDLVYAGYRGSYLDEKSKLIPASLYAETKLVGEQKIRNTFDNFLILRTALLFGFGLAKRKSHFQIISEELRKEKEVKLFEDQFRSPLFVKDAARMIGDLIEKNISGEVLNFGGTERLSRFQLGEILCEEAGFNKSLLKKISMDEINNFTKVEDVSLNVERLLSKGLKPIEVREAVRRIFVGDV